MPQCKHELIAVGGEIWFCIKEAPHYDSHVYEYEVVCAADKQPHQHSAHPWHTCVDWRPAPKAAPKRT